MPRPTELIAGLHTGRGKLTSVKITLMGRPTDVSEQAAFTLLNLTVTRAAFPTLPRGVPLPEPVPPTTYSVFIGKKQWKQVAESLKQPKDVLIIEGTQMLNAAARRLSSLRRARPRSCCGGRTAWRSRRRGSA